MLDSYRWLVSSIGPGTTAVDIGANIGDTAVYLAMQNNVKRVFAYEPFPYTYNRAKNYIKNSPFYSKKIKIINAGISEKHSFMNLIPGFMASDDSELTNSNGGVKVEVFSINQILEGLDNVIIKCDCEKTEHKIFTEEANFDNVKRIQIEYHLGVKRIPSVLKSKGFNVSIKADKTSPASIEKPKYRQRGYICAWR